MIRTSTGTPWTARLGLLMTLGTALAAATVPPHASAQGGPKPASASSPAAKPAPAKTASPLTEAKGLLDASDPTKVAAALEQLAKLGGAACSITVAQRTALGLPDALAVKALDTLVACRHPASSGKAVLELMEHRVPVVRARAVRAAGELGLAQARTALLTTLDDGEASVRAEAATALITLRSQPQLKTVFELWEAGSVEAADVVGALASPTDRTRVLAPLTRGDVEKVAPVLSRIVARDDWPVAARLKLIEALQASGLPASASLLHQWSQALTDKRLRKAAFDATKTFESDAPTDATPPNAKRPHRFGLTVAEVSR